MLFRFHSTLTNDVASKIHLRRLSNSVQVGVGKENNWILMKSAAKLSSPALSICYAINTYPVSDKSNSRTTLALAVIGVELTWVLVLQWKGNSAVYFTNLAGFTLLLNCFCEQNKLIPNVYNCIWKHACAHTHKENLRFQLQINIQVCCININFSGAQDQIKGYLDKKIHEMHEHLWNITIYAIL